jgi:phosphatidylglycerol lysyltransferase
MFRVERRTWVSLGDPVATSEVADDLAWTFRDLAAQQGGWAVFYQVREEYIPRYVGLGLAVLKLGEEARVRLESFDIDTPARSPLREAIQTLQGDGLSFDIVNTGDVEPMLPALRSVAESWARGRQRESTRSLAGVFEPGYFDRGPLIVAREADRIVAFANLWLSADKEEASVDLIRHRPELPDTILLALVASLATWAASENFVWFSLGIAPHVGVEPTRRSPLWNRAVNVLYRHREHFAGFASLRAFNNAFAPVWEGRYLASPSDLRLGTALRDISRLVSAMPGEDATHDNQRSA